MLKSQFIIRDYQKEDLHSLVVLYQSVFSQKKVSVELIKKIFRDEPAQFLIAQDKNGLCGFVYYWVVHDQFEVIDLGVHENSRRLGLGLLLIEELVCRARAEGIKKIILEVNDKNFAARALYERCGFVETGKRRKYYSDGGDALLLDKIL